MQLRPLPRPRGARAGHVAGLLALAVGNLLGREAAALELHGVSIDQATLFYQEQGRIGVVEPVVTVRLPLPGEQALSLHYGFDAMSGASPNGATPTVTSHTYTSPSGNSYTVSRGELPVHAFRDIRNAGSVDYERPLSRRLKLNTGLNASFETDYRSLGASLSLALELNQKLTTLSLGLSTSADRLRPQGGVPVPLSDYMLRVPGADGANKRIEDVLLGLTQVMGRGWLTQLNLGLGRDQGDMTDPYKGVSLVDAQGEPTRWVFESRPDARTRATLFWGNAVHLGRDVIHADWRVYHDSWGVRANTVSLQYWLKPELGLPGLRARPELRFSSQSRADFYAHSVMRSAYEAAPPAHLSADSRLAAMQSWAFSLRVDLPETDWGQLWLKPMYLRQQFSLSPGAVGVQQQVDLVPDLKVWMVTLGFRTTL
jgi:hypothetical protein